MAILEGHEGHEGHEGYHGRDRGNGTGRRLDLSSDQLLFWCRCGAGAGRCCHACLPSQYNFPFAPLILQLYLRIMRAQPSHQEVLSCSLICFLFFYIHCIYYNKRSAPVGVRYLLLLLGQEIRPKKGGAGHFKTGTPLLQTRKHKV